MSNSTENDIFRITIADESRRHKQTVTYRLAYSGVNKITIELPKDLILQWAKNVQFLDHALDTWSFTVLVDLLDIQDHGFEAVSDE